MANLTIICNPWVVLYRHQIEQRVQRSIRWPGDAYLLPPLWSRNFAQTSQQGIYLSCDLQRSSYRNRKTLFPMRECDIHHIYAFNQDLILTAPLIWAASLGWVSAVTCFNIYREYYVLITVGKLSNFFILHYYRALLAPSLKLSFIWNVARYNYFILWMIVFAQLGFCFILFYQ